MMGARKGGVGRDCRWVDREKKMKKGRKGGR